MLEIKRRRVMRALTKMPIEIPKVRQRIIELHTYILQRDFRYAVYKCGKINHKALLVPSYRNA